MKTKIKTNKFKLIVYAMILAIAVTAVTSLCLANNNSENAQALFHEDDRVGIVPQVDGWSISHTGLSDGRKCNVSRGVDIICSQRNSSGELIGPSNQARFDGLQGESAHIDVKANTANDDYKLSHWGIYDEEISNSYYNKSNRVFRDYAPYDYGHRDEYNLEGYGTPYYLDINDEGSNFATRLPIWQYNWNEDSPCWHTNSYYYACLADKISVNYDKNIGTVDKDFDYLYMYDCFSYNYEGGVDYNHWSDPENLNVGWAMRSWINEDGSYILTFGNKCLIGRDESNVYGVDIPTRMNVFTATPKEGNFFKGWKVENVKGGWSEPLTLPIVMEDAEIFTNKTDESPLIVTPLFVEAKSLVIEGNRHYPVFEDGKCPSDIKFLDQNGDYITPTGADGTYRMSDCVNAWYYSGSSELPTFVMKTGSFNSAFDPDGSIITADGGTAKKYVGGGIDDMDVCESLNIHHSENSLSDVNASTIKINNVSIEDIMKAYSFNDVVWSADAVSGNNAYTYQPYNAKWSQASRTSESSALVLFSHIINGTKPTPTPDPDPDPDPKPDPTPTPDPTPSPTPDPYNGGTGGHGGYSSGDDSIIPAEFDITDFSTWPGQTGDMAIIVVIYAVALVVLGVVVTSRLVRRASKKRSRK